jgi:hypothetical protein
VDKDKTEKALFAYLRTEEDSVPIIEGGGKRTPPYKRLKRARAILKLSLGELYLLQDLDFGTGSLVHIRTKERDRSKEMVHLDSRAKLSGVLSETMVFHGNRHGLPDQPLVDAFLADPDPKEELPKIRPAIDPDGRVVDKRGMRGKHGLYLLHSDETEVSDKPTKQEIEKAKKIVLEPFCDFNFKAYKGNASSLAAVLAAVFESVIGPLICGPRPGYLIEAHALGQGVGKTRLAQVISAIITGTDPVPTQSLPVQESEREKALTAVLRNRPVVVHVDNLKGEVSSPSLDNILTSTRYTNRLLGKTAMLDLPNRATWLFTANAAHLDRDLSRRLVSVGIDRSGPTYKHDPLLPWLAKQQKRINWALLTLARAWHVAGKPQSTIHYPSYEDWVSNVGGLVEFCGVSGLAECIADSATKDTLKSDLAEFVDLWWQNFGTDDVVAQDIYDSCIKDRGLFPGLERKLRHAKSEASCVGRWLRDYVDLDCLPHNAKIHRRKSGGTKYCMQRDT